MAQEPYAVERKTVQEWLRHLGGPGVWTKPLTTATKQVNVR